MKYKDLMQHRADRGLCCYCGKEKIAPGSSRSGTKCLAKRALQHRVRKGYKSQEESGRGRPKL
jgi:hypothetical protein